MGVAGEEEIGEGEPGAQPSFPSWEPWEWEWEWEWGWGWS